MVVGITHIFSELTFKDESGGWAWRHKPVCSTRSRLKEEDPEFEISPSWTLFCGGERARRGRREYFCGRRRQLSSHQHPERHSGVEWRIQGVNHSPGSARWAGPRPCSAQRSLTGTRGSGGTGCGLLGGPIYLLPVPRDAHPGQANAAVSATLLVPEWVRSGPMSCRGVSAAVW